MDQSTLLSNYVDISMLDPGAGTRELVFDNIGNKIDYCLLIVVVETELAC